MADINIFGTLKNVTGEPIVRAEQVAGVGEIPQSVINENLMAGKRYEESQWIPNKSEVENSLNSDSTTTALSAAQGNELKRMIDNLKVDNSRLLNNAVTTDKIEDGAVNEDKLDDTLKTRLDSFATTLAMNEAITAAINESVYEVLNDLEF